MKRHESDHISLSAIHSILTIFGSLTVIWLLVLYSMQEEWYVAMCLYYIIPFTIMDVLLPGLLSRYVLLHIWCCMCWMIKICEYKYILYVASKGINLKILAHGPSYSQSQHYLALIILDKNILHTMDTLYELLKYCICFCKGSLSC